MRTNASTQANNKMRKTQVLKFGQIVHDMLEIFGMRLFNQIALYRNGIPSPELAQLVERSDCTQHRHMIIYVLMFILFDEFDEILRFEPQGMIGNRICKISTKQT